MNVITILKWVKSHHNIVSKAILSVLVALFLLSGVILYNKNKMLQNRLEIAQNNIEAYQGAISGAQQANNVLKLDMSQLQYQNDSLIHKMDSIGKKLNIKSKQINTAATQTQSILVKQSKGVRGYNNNQNLVTILTKDSIYKDSIQYNDLTKVYYTIGKDTVNIALDVKNTQYLYTYKKRQYKNKKSFIKRIFTLDFKKVDVYKYEIINTNDLLKTTDVRVIESIEK